MSPDNEVSCDPSKRPPTMTVHLSTILSSMRSPGVGPTGLFFQLSRKTSIASLKQILLDEIKAPIWQQLFVYEGKELPDR